MWEAKEHLFELKGANEGDIPSTRYFETNVIGLVLQIPKVRFLVVRNPYKLLKPKHKTKLPSIVGWNVVE